LFNTSEKLFCIVPLKPKTKPYKSQLSRLVLLRFKNQLETYTCAKAELKHLRGELLYVENRKGFLEVEVSKVLDRVQELEKLHALNDADMLSLKQRIQDRESMLPNVSKVANDKIATLQFIRQELAFHEDLLRAEVEEGVAQHSAT
jgi:hypothetical protein